MLIVVLFNYFSIQFGQNQFGTERKLVATPASRVASLSGVSSNIAKAGDFRLRVAPGTRDTAQANSEYFFLLIVIN